MMGIGQYRFDVIERALQNAGTDFLNTPELFIDPHDGQDCKNASEECEPEAHLKQ